MRGAARRHPRRFLRGSARAMARPGSPDTGAEREAPEAADALGEVAAAGGGPGDVALGQLLVLDGDLDAPDVAGGGPQAADLLPHRPVLLVHGIGHLEQREGQGQLHRPAGWRRGRPTGSPSPATPTALASPGRSYSRGLTIIRPSADAAQQRARRRADHQHVVQRVGRVDLELEEVGVAPLTSTNTSTRSPAAPDRPRRVPCRSRARRGCSPRRPRRDRRRPSGPGPARRHREALARRMDEGHRDNLRRRPAPLVQPAVHHDPVRRRQSTAGGGTSSPAAGAGVGASAGAGAVWPAGAGRAHPGRAARRTPPPCARDPRALDLRRGFGSIPITRLRWRVSVHRCRPAIPPTRGRLGRCRRAPAAPHIETAVGTRNARSMRKAASGGRARRPAEPSLPKPDEQRTRSGAEQNLYRRERKERKGSTAVPVAPRRDSGPRACRVAAPPRGASGPGVDADLRAASRKPGDKWVTTSMPGGPAPPRSGWWHAGSGVTRRQRHSILCLPGSWRAAGPPRSVCALYPFGGLRPRRPWQAEQSSDGR